MDSKEVEKIFNTCNQNDKICIICGEKIEAYIPNKIMYVKTKLLNHNLFFHKSCYKGR